MSLPTDDKARKRLQMFTYLMEYFPDAFLAEVEVAVAGNEQHNPGQPLHWAREKSKDQLNTAFRHLWDHARGTKKDVDGQWHLAKAIWRLKAQLQLEIENDKTNEAFDRRVYECRRPYPWRFLSVMSFGCCLAHGHDGAHQLSDAEAEAYGMRRVMWDRERCREIQGQKRCMEVEGHDTAHRFATDSARG